MARYYLSPVEYIKERPFDVLSPAFYEPYFPSEMLDARPAPLEKPNRFKPVATRRRNPAPFRQLEDPNRLQKGAFSIEIMLDMFRKKIQFQILNDEDVVEILDALDRYLMSLKLDVEMGNENVISYASLVIDFRAEIYKHYFRYMKTHPDALARLYPNADPKKNLLFLMSATSGINKEQLELDPLLAKAKPPYTIGSAKPKETDIDRIESSIESSLGLSSSHILKDDGKDFDFDDFLKR